MPRTHWGVMENQKKLMDKVAKQLNITNSKDWGKVTIEQMYQLGGGYLVTKHYNSSLFLCLQSIYKGSFFPQVTYRY